MGYRCRCCSEKIPQADSVCPKCGYNNGVNTMEAVLAEMLRLYGQKEFLARADMVNVFGDLAPELRDERLMLKYLYEVDGPTELFASIGRPATEAQLLVNRVISRLKSKFISEEAAREICSRFLSVLGGSMPRIEEHSEEEKPPRKWMIPAIACAALLALVIGGVAIFGEQEKEKPAIVSPSSVPLPSANTVSAKNKCGENVWWELEDGVLTISGSGEMENYLTYSAEGIPGAMTPWTENFNAVRSVIIEDGITSIGSGAFLTCFSLSSVTLPDSLTEIGDYAFQYCHSLTEIAIPGGVTMIGRGAFDSCDALTSVTIPAGVTEINAETFWSCEALATVTLPDSLTIIGDYAFEYCKALTTVTLPDGLKVIGDGTFGRSGLTGIDFPDSVTKIGEWAFAYCHGLTEVTIPTRVTELGAWTFGKCTGLTEITLPAGLTEIDREAFTGCDQLTIHAPAGSYALRYAQENGYA